MTNTFTGLSGSTYEVASKSMKVTTEEGEAFELPLSRSFKESRELIQSMIDGAYNVGLSDYINLLEDFVDKKLFDKLSSLDAAIFIEIVTTWMEKFSDRLFVYIEDHEDPKES